MTDPDDDIARTLKIAETLRAHLAPLWQAYWDQWNGLHPLPSILSTHLCRESSHAALRALEAAGHEGWQVQAGAVSLFNYVDVPLDVTNLDGANEDDSIEEAAHTWLVNEALGIRLDLTADQFGQVDTVVIEPLDAGEDYIDLLDEVDWMDDPDISDVVDQWTTVPSYDETVEVLKSLTPAQMVAFAL